MVPCALCLDKSSHQREFETIETKLRANRVCVVNASTIGNISCSRALQDYGSFVDPEGKEILAEFAVEERAVRGRKQPDPEEKKQVLRNVA